MEVLVTVPGAEPWSAAGSGERAGTGVVVVHGLTGNPIATRPLGQRLAEEGYRVDVPLLPGHGTSHRDLGRTRYADWFAAVEHAAGELAASCDRVVLVGHSLGATLSLDLASRRPNEFAGVVSINAQVLDPQQLMARLAPVLQYLMPYVHRDLAGLPTNDIAMPGVEEGSYRYVASRAAQSLIVELRRIRAQLPDLVGPLLVVSSAVDHSVDPRNADALCGLVDGGELTRLDLDRSYHVPMLDYDAPRLERAVVAFVDGVHRSSV